MKDVSASCMSCVIATEMIQVHELDCGGNTSRAPKYTPAPIVDLDVSDPLYNRGVRTPATE